jgi:hypothetical protein
VVVVGDGGNYIDGTGTYTLNVTGVPEQNKSLRLRRASANTVVLGWPSERRDEILQQSDSITPPNWIDVLTVGFDNSLNKGVALPIEGDQRFYRLHRP